MSTGAGVSEDEDWEVVDELLVHVEMSGIVQGGSLTDGLRQNSKFIGLDSDRPIVQIGSQVRLIFKPILMLMLSFCPKATP